MSTLFLQFPEILSYQKLTKYLLHDTRRCLLSHRGSPLWHKYLSWYPSHRKKRKALSIG